MALQDTGLMIDLETLGTTPDCFILSIGAAEFNLETGEIGQTFHQRVDPELDQPGRRISPGTVKWWMGQSDAARKDVVRGDIELDELLFNFRRFVGDVAPGTVWGNGSTFDISILEHAYNYQPPWRFFAVSDCRTVEMLASPAVTRRQFKRQGTHHSALDDAIYQAQYISAMIRHLRGVK